MLDLKFIRENTEVLKNMLLKRNSDINLDKFQELDIRKRILLAKVEELRRKRNIASSNIAKMKKMKKNITEEITEMGNVALQIKKLDASLVLLDEEINYIQKTIPNILHETVPIGNNEEDNQVIRLWGTPKNFSFEPKPHWKIAEDLDILDFERGAKLGGSRFVIYKSDGAKLERALINFMLDVQTEEHGYTEFLTPFIVKREICEGTGQLPKFEDDMYKTIDDMFLISTSEISLTNIYRDEILTAKDLPRYLVAYSPCFRREAGSYGKDVKGLIRQHQFNKVEMVKLTTPETSYTELEKMVLNAETILQKLELPYRVVSLCSGDLGFSATKTYDLEVWIPSQNKYREISSCSNCGDFQARRMNLKYKPTSQNKSEFIHTLNGSGLAIGRTVVAIIENYQQEDGSFLIPKILIPYMNGKTIVEIL